MFTSIDASMFQGLGSDTVKKFLVACLGAAAFAGAPAMAADMPTKAPVAPPPVAVGGFFGELLGAYDFKDPIQGWQQFGAGSGTVSTPEVGIGSGWNGKAVVGYRWSAWDVAFAGEYGKFTDGDTHDRHRRFLPGDHFGQDAGL